MKKAASFALTLLAVCSVYYMAVITGGCAQIGMPMGGPKDTLPPVLLSSVPENKSTNFKSNRITLTFDEYVQLDNPTQNVLISPLPKKQPFIDFKLKTVTVKLYDTLMPNKTYSIQFGNAIRDLNENNPFKGFDYVFSTGTFIDSLTLNGTVLVAESGKADSTLTVMLYSDMGDSAVYKHKPDYIARLNNKGDFAFRYLAAGEYQIFAIKDESGQYMYNNPEQLFGFADSPIVIKAGVPLSHPQLYVYQEELPRQKPTTAKADTTLKFVTNISGGVQDLLEPLTLTFNNPVRTFDSSVIVLTDTLFNKVEKVTYSEDSTKKIFSLNYNWQGSADYRLLVPEGSVTDTSGHQLLKNDTLKLKTKNESDYGSIKLNFTNLEKYQNPVLMLAADKGKTESFPLTSNTFEKRLIAPGNYFIMILEDKNKNGRWDPGNYHLRLQPEIVHRLEEPVNIRANWENEKDITL